MKQDFILGKLALIMGWSNDEARDEFAWLRLMSRMKYDDYQDFLAGARFVESLADWLQQFNVDDRLAAYEFVRKSLLYVSTAEMNHLVELFYPETVVQHLQQAVSSRINIPTWQVWATEESSRLFERLLRQTLFIELSDGARIDVFRRANAGVISNEQTVTAPRLNDEKWDDMLRDLRSDLKDPESRFAFVFLIDDFVGSGTTLLRRNSDRTWTGKLWRFWDENRDRFSKYFEDGWSVCVHHYIATHHASEAVNATNTAVGTEYGAEGWFRSVRFSFGSVLPLDLPLTRERDGKFLDLVERYYDSGIETRHTQVAGPDVRMGFSRCALPLILEHNTPNNSVALLWAESDGEGGQHAMRPLFRRRQRHI